MSTMSLPSGQSNGPMTALAAPARISALPALLKLPAKPDRRLAVQLTPKPLRPPPTRRKNATTGKAIKNSPALRLLAGSLGISSGSSKITYALGLRIEAVHQLVEFCSDIRPA